MEKKDRRRSGRLDSGMKARKEHFLVSTIGQATGYNLAFKLVEGYPYVTGNGLRFHIYELDTGYWAASEDESGINSGIFGDSAKEVADMLDERKEYLASVIKHPSFGKKEIELKKEIEKVLIYK